MGRKKNRYKIRKRNNHVKRKSVFDSSPKLISSWEELDGLESEDGSYFIRVDFRFYNGWVRPKKQVPEDEWYDHNVYLSTHSFYGKQYFATTRILQLLGFNVQLKNWDGETVYCR